MSKPYYGKKVGTLEVKLDRKKTRYTWASVKVELRFDIEHGDFHAQFEGNWYTAKTKAGLSEQIKLAATKAFSIEWKRYLKIGYTAKGWPIEDAKSGRPACSGQYHTYDLGDDRSALRANIEGDDSPHVICSVALHWSVCEISEPYTLPEDPKKQVRAQREVDVHRWGPDTGTEMIGEPQEWEDAVLPPGTLLWTPEREAVLAEIIGALGKLDQRLVALFSGDAAQLALKIDTAAQMDPGRLLAAPAEPEPAEPEPAEPSPKRQPKRRIA